MREFLDQNAPPASKMVDLAGYRCVREEALRRIRLILDQEVRRGVASDMNREITLRDPSGETLLIVPFGAALAPVGVLN